MAHTSPQSTHAPARLSGDTTESRLSQFPAPAPTTRTDSPKPGLTSDAARLWAERSKVLPKAQQELHAQLAAVIQKSPTCGLPGFVEWDDNRHIIAGAYGTSEESGP